MEEQRNGRDVGEIFKGGFSLWEAVLAAAVILAAFLLTGCQGKPDDSLVPYDWEKDTRYFAEIVPYKGKDYGLLPGQGLETLPFEHGRFTIYQDMVYYILPDDPQTSIYACKLDGSEQKVLAADYKVSGNSRIMIAGNYLFYEFQNGDFLGLAYIDLSDGIRREIHLAYSDSLEMQGVYDGYLYYSQILTAEGMGKDERGDYVFSSSEQTEISRYHLKTTESEKLVMIPATKITRGGSRIQMAGDRIYYWELQGKDGADPAVGEYQLCSYKDRTYVKYPVYSPGVAYVIHDGWVYYADGGMVCRYPLGEEPDWGEGEDVYGNKVYHPEGDERLESLVQLPEEIGAADGLVVGNKGIYVMGDRRMVCIVNDGGERKIRQ